MIHGLVSGDINTSGRLTVRLAMLSVSGGIAVRLAPIGRGPTGSRWLRYWCGFPV